jgi:hypothetical protein
MNSLFLNSINLILSAIGGRITTSEILPVINYFFVRILNWSRVRVYVDHNNPLLLCRLLSCLAGTGLLGLVGKDGKAEGYANKADPTRHRQLRQKIVESEIAKLMQLSC